MAKKAHKEKRGATNGLVSFMLESIIIEIVNSIKISE
jgi:hypothetical protein